MKNWIKATVTPITSNEEWDNAQPPLQLWINLATCPQIHLSEIRAIITQEGALSAKWRVSIPGRSRENSSMA